VKRRHRQGQQGVDVAEADGHRMNICTMDIFLSTAGEFRRRNAGLGGRRWR
jgi:hypothetical protein